MIEPASRGAITRTTYSCFIMHGWTLRMGAAIMLGTTGTTIVSCLLSKGPTLGSAKKLGVLTTSGRLDGKLPNQSLRIGTGAKAARGPSTNSSLQAIFRIRGSESGTSLVAGSWAAPLLPLSTTRPDGGLTGLIGFLGCLADGLVLASSRPSSARFGIAGRQRVDSRTQAGAFSVSVMALRTASNITVVARL